MARLSPGDAAPDFTLPDADGRPVSLSDFRDNEASLQAHGYAVLGISPDPPARLARFRDEQGLTYPLLADESREVLTAYGAYGEKSLYGKTVLGVIRSTFVIAGDGRLERILGNVKATGHVAKLRRDLGIG